MKRHRFDPISFVFGALFVALAAAVALPGDPWEYLYDGFTLGWVWPVLIIAIGVALLADGLRGRQAVEADPLGGEEEHSPTGIAGAPQN
jgi:hypothetical protein